MFVVSTRLRALTLWILAIHFSSLASGAYLSDSGCPCSNTANGTIAGGCRTRIGFDNATSGVTWCLTDQEKRPGCGTVSAFGYADTCINASFLAVEVIPNQALIEPGQSNLTFYTGQSINLTWSFTLFENAESVQVSVFTPTLRNLFGETSTLPINSNSTSQIIPANVTTLAGSSPVLISTVPDSIINSNSDVKVKNSTQFISILQSTINYVEARWNKTLLDVNTTVPFDDQVFNVRWTAVGMARFGTATVSIQRCGSGGTVCSQTSPTTNSQIGNSAPLVLNPYTIGVNEVNLTFPRTANGVNVGNFYQLVVSVSTGGGAATYIYGSAGFTMGAAPLSCVSGSNYSSTGLAPCTSCSNCSFGITTPCNATSNTVCASTPSCVNGTNYSSTGLAPCTSCSNCTFGITTNCNATADTVCAPPPSCASGTNYSSTGLAPCTSCSNCSFGITTNCNATADTVCASPPSCVSGTNYSSTGLAPCTPCKTCTTSITTNCNATADTVCASPPSCVSGTNYSSTGLAPCTPCKTCTTSITTNCNATADTVCASAPSSSATPTSCPAGSWIQAGMSSCVLCSPGTYSTSNSSICLPCPIRTYGNTAGLTTEACSGPCPSCTVPGTSHPPSLILPLTCATNTSYYSTLFNECVQFNQTDCPLRLFPSADLAGDRLDSFVSPSESFCAGACCGRTQCLGYSYTNSILRTCTLLSNITYVIPSSVMSGGVRNTVLGL
jgi:hypothetical protein